MQPKAVQPASRLHVRQSRGSGIFAPSRPERGWVCMATILLVDGDPLQAFLRVSLLQRQFGDVQRVDSAAEALCLVEQPNFAEHLRLVISAYLLPGLVGPAFVAELHERMPGLQVLVLGGNYEAARDYEGQRVSFLPGRAPSREMLKQAEQMLSTP